MPDPQVTIPDCFCPENQDCEWEVKMNISYCRQGDSEEETFTVNSVQRDLPAVVAHAIATEVAAQANATGQDIYLAWLDGCMAQQQPGLMVRAMMKRD